MHILIPIDFSDVTDAVVGQALVLAQALKARVTLLHVAAPDPEFVGYEAGPQSVRDAIAKRYHEEHRKLREVEKRAAGQGVEVASLLIQGYTVEKILKEAQSLKASLIVMGSHGHGPLRHLLVGSITEGVLRKAPCPVVVVPSSNLQAPG